MNVFIVIISILVAFGSICMLILSVPVIIAGLIFSQAFPLQFITVAFLGLLFLLLSCIILSAMRED